MTLTDTQLAEIVRKTKALHDHRYGMRSQSPGDSAEIAEAFDDLLAHIVSLESQLSTIRKEATDAEREACAKIADVTKGAAVYAFWSGERACHSVAESIRARSNLPGSRAPTGDEGK